MPTGNSTGDYQRLTDAITGTSTTQYSGNYDDEIRDSFSLPLSGYYYLEGYKRLGEYGIIWSSSGFNTNAVYRFLYGDGTVITQDTLNRSRGYSVRCTIPSHYTITFKTNNATGIVFNGVTYTDGQTLTVSAEEVAGKEYHIYGNYDTRYAFSSWNATNGTFSNQNYQNTTYTITGDATITLTGQYVNTVMQNLSLSNCSTTAMPVYDNRDSSVYWVQKLPDGNCWMLDNLTLDLTSSSIVNSLSTSNTNLDATSLTKFKDGSGTTSDRYPTAAYGTQGSTGSFSQPLTYMNNKDITLRPASAENYTDSVSEAYGQGQGKVGAYYNYCAASVGYYCFGNGASAGTPSGKNDYDICPAGWRMPTGNTAGEYTILYTNPAINSDNSIFRETLSTSLTGDYNENAVDKFGELGYFWSSDRATNTYTYRLSLSSSVVTPSGSGSRAIGRSVRCIIVRNISDLEYMQDFATLSSAGKADVLKSMTLEQQYQLKDSRDEKTYYISKLADGNVWMTQNLDHDIVTTAGYYTYANTDIGHGATPNTSATWTAQTATYATNDTTWSLTANNPESYDPGDLCWNGTLGEYTIATGTTTCGNDKHMHIGNYYNWTAAVAMNDSSSYTTDEQDVDQSICPAGWRLPTLSGDKSYDNLVTELGLTSGTSGNIQNTPVYFVYGGDWNGLSNVVGYYGFYWSSVVNHDDYAYEFSFRRNGAMNPQNVDDRYDGHSVRCVAR